MKAESRGRVCKRCKTEILRDVLDKRDSICPECGYYMRLHAYKRIGTLADNNKFIEWELKKNFPIHYMMKSMKGY
jgi:acetyl-CoA carboxylase beta subunit